MTGHPPSKSGTYPNLSLSSDSDRNRNSREPRRRFEDPATVAWKLYTRFCVAWFERYGVAERAYGEAEVLFTAKNTSFAGLKEVGVIVGGGGKVRLSRREELEQDWDPARDRRLADWECVQHLVRAMTAEAGGGVAEAARLALVRRGRKTPVRSPEAAKLAAGGPAQAEMGV